MKYDDRSLKQIARGIFMYEVLGAKRSDLNEILADFANILSVIDADRNGGLRTDGYCLMARTLFDEASRATGQSFDDSVIRDSIVPMLRGYGSPTPQAQKILDHVIAHLDSVPD